MSLLIQRLTKQLELNIQDLQIRLFHQQQMREAIIQEIYELQEGLLRAESNSMMINPELENNRLRFILWQQEHHHQLLKQSQTLLMEEENLRYQIQQEKTHLKALEKHLHRQSAIQKQQQINKEALKLDEWVLQRGAMYES